MTTPLAIALAELRSALEKSYRNTVYCAGTLEQDEDGRLRGKYCGNRWCLVCNRIRIARAITRYLPILQAWQDPQLVTLTLPNVKAEELESTISTMLRDLPAIGRAIKRTDRLPFRALRKLECTYNPARDDYHPHFHIAVDGLPEALALRDRWLKLHPETRMEAQDVRPCDSQGLFELFKYFTKLVVKLPPVPPGWSPGQFPRAILASLPDCAPDQPLDCAPECAPTAFQSRVAGRILAPAGALDVIFCAMKGRRVFQPMGFRAAPTPAKDEEEAVGTDGDTRAPSRLGERVAWDWLQDFHDWVDLTTGECLTGFCPSQAIMKLATTIAITGSTLTVLARRITLQ